MTMATEPLSTTSSLAEASASAETLWSADDAAFPERVKKSPSPPHQLYTIGNRAVLNAPCVAIVGTRHPTRYGERIARDLAQAFVRAGACVVSGMAYGIDSYAHRGALDAGGKTVAVLGGGVDVVYPARHHKLYAEIAAHGLIVSEFEPGHPMFEGCFPRRNRIIAGLCDLTIVVEASVKSGALITANYALEMGRTVAAVPGPIDVDQSQGPNRLLRDGAQVITCVNDALALLGIAPSKRGAKAAAPTLSGDEATVWDILATPGVTTDDIVSRTGLPVNRCMVAITNLEIHGLVECLLTGEIRRT